MGKPFLLFLLPIAAAIDMQARAAQMSPVACPASISERSSLLRDEGGWTPILRTAERPLEHVGLLIGTGDELSALVPDSARKSPTHEFVVWEVSPLDTTPHWVGCSYVGTSALLVRRLVPKIGRCTVAYALLKSGSRAKVSSVTCQ